MQVCQAAIFVAYHELSVTMLVNELCIESQSLLPCLAQSTDYCIHLYTYLCWALLGPTPLNQPGPVSDNATEALAQRSLE